VIVFAISYIVNRLNTMITKC